MFNKIVQKLRNYFSKTKTELETVTIVKDVTPEIINLTTESKAEEEAVVDPIEEKSKVTKDLITVKDTKEKLISKLNLIIRRTKSRRIRNKNLKRLNKLLID